MSETNKTLSFLAVAATVCLAAYISQPRSAEIDAEAEVGNALTKEFSTDDARRMKITRFDEDSATLDSFEVAQVGQLWSIPSKEGYPADATEQMAKAVDGVRGREILSVASKSAEDHQEYGVIDPTSDNLSPGDTGVGTRVTLEDESGGALVDLVIGQVVKDADGLHYVRRASQDAVYVVQIDPADFSTKFEDWIEGDLLQVNPWDLKQVRLNDYTSQLFLTNSGPGIDIDCQEDMTFAYNDSDSKWEPVEMKEAVDPSGSEYKPFKLAENEEVNDESLNDLKNALDDLAIVDVVKKPAGLSADLKAGKDFLTNNEARLSLMTRGFAPMEGGELLCTSGEVVATMKDGVEYVLRLGDPQIDPSAEKETAEDDAKSKQGLNRYLFVLARLNEDAIEKPELEDVPEVAEATDDGADEAEADDANDTAEGEESEATDEETGEDKADEQSQESDEAEVEEKSEVTERDAIVERNERKQDEYQAKVKEAEEKVAMLNDRFGDWYYVVSGEEFSKIRLGRQDVIKEKELAEGEEDSTANLLGTPGSAIPGLPDLSGVDSTDQTEEADEPAEEAMAEEPAGETSESTNQAAEAAAAK